MEIIIVLSIVVIVSGFFAVNSNYNDWWDLPAAFTSVISAILLVVAVATIPIQRMSDAVTIAQIESVRDTA